MTRSRNITPRYIVSETRLMRLLNELPCDVEGVVAKEIRSHPYNAGVYGMTRTQWYLFLTITHTSAFGCGILYHQIVRCMGLPI
jgi:hypothetical protein